MSDSNQDIFDKILGLAQKADLWRKRALRLRNKYRASVDDIADLEAQLKAWETRFDEAVQKKRTQLLDSELTRLRQLNQGLEETMRIRDQQLANTRAWVRDLRRRIAQAVEIGDDAVRVVLQTETKDPES